MRLVLPEAESTALLAYLGPGDVVCSQLARTELRRAVRRYDDPAAEVRADELLDRLRLLAVDIPTLDSAGVLPPVELRSLDAVHLAAVEGVRARLRAVVTYDVRMLDAARAAGLPVAHPGRP